MSNPYKKILLIHHRLPYPAHSGMDKARFSLLCILNKRYHVTLIVPANTKLNSEYIDCVKQNCSKLIIFNDPKKKNKPFILTKKINTILNVLKSILIKKPFFLEASFSKEFALEILRLHKKEAFHVVQPLSDFSLEYAKNLHPKPFLLFGPNDDMVGMSEGILRNTRSGLHKFLQRIEIRSRKNWQVKNLRYADISFYFSKSDIKKIINRNPDLFRKVKWIPGVIEYKNNWNKRSPNLVEKNSIVFTGGLVSEFNRQALSYFFEKIWPLITTQIKEVKIYIVGQAHGKGFEHKYSFPNVFYTGKVESVQPWLEKAAVFVNPAVSGTGIKTKMVEALRFGKPIVTTSEGTSGLWKIPENTINICHNAQSFSEQVIKLLLDDDLRLKIALRNRQLFEEEYSITVLRPKILKIYEKVFDENNDKLNNKIIQ